MCTYHGINNNNNKKKKKKKGKKRVNSINKLNLTPLIYSLAFDYHDETYYHFSGVFGPAEANQKRNEVKVDMCEKNGIALINVP
jgi:hypothetical protein